MRAQRFFMAAVAMAAVFGPAPASASPSLPPQPVTLRQVAAGFTLPVDIANARDHSDRLFVVEKGGLVRIVKDGAVNPLPFLDLTAQVATAGERGLLGIAFHPLFKANRRFFVAFNRSSDGALQVDSFLASAINPDVADPASQAPVLSVLPAGVANFGGHLAFGPDDGYLWISTGDGGGPVVSTDNPAQDLMSAHGKLLRIDVNPPAGAGVRYVIPPTNPFYGSSTALQEIAALGLRDPRKFSFDRVLPRLFIGDIGRSTQEIDYMTFSNGRPTLSDYGWNQREGWYCTAMPCLSPQYTGPVMTGGGKVIGGFVYRGMRSEKYHGLYFWGDAVSNQVYALFYQGWWQNWQVHAGTGLQGLSSFGENEAGDLFLTSSGDGVLYAIDLPGDFPMEWPFKLVDEPVQPDFDGDGKTDVAWRHPWSDAHQLWLMNGATYTAGPVSGGVRAVIHHLADYDGDGRTDILWREADGAYRIDLMSGLTATSSTRVLPGGYWWEVVGSGDFNGDGKADLLWRTQYSYGIWLMNGASAIANGLLAVPGFGAEVVALGDFNGDGKSDLVWQTLDESVLLALMDGVNVLTGPVEIYRPPYKYWTVAATADFNGDGKSDLFWKTKNYQFGMWLMEGLTRLESKVLRSDLPGWAADPGTGWTWSRSWLGDVDGDGKADVMWMNFRNGGEFEAWLLDGTTTKSVVALQPAGQMGWRLQAIGNYDGSGPNDLFWWDSSNVTPRTAVMLSLSPPALTSIVPTQVTGWVIAPWRRD